MFTRNRTQDQGAIFLEAILPEKGGKRKVGEGLTFV